jgi:hypothetical protein
MICQIANTAGIRGQITYIAIVGAPFGDFSKDGVVFDVFHHPTSMIGVQVGRRALKFFCHVAKVLSSIVVDFHEAGECL